MRFSAACCATALLSTSALAEPRTDTVALVWRRDPGAESCPNDKEIARKVAARLGRDPFVDNAERIVEARVLLGARGWRAEIRIVDRTGKLIATREPLESTANDCAALADAAVLSIALAIDPEAALAAPPPAPPAPACPPVNCPSPECPACPAAIPPPEPRRLAASLQAIGALGILPRAALGVGLSAEVEALRSLSVGVAFIYLPEVETDSGELAFGLTAIEPFSCFSLASSDSGDLAACAGFQVGSLHGVSRSLYPVEPGDYLWLAASAGPRGLLRPARGLALSLSVSAVVPLIAHDFVVEGKPGSAHQPATIGVLGSIGIGVEAP